MSSNLRVNNILPSVGTNVAIGTAGGNVTLTGSVTGDITGNVSSTGISTFSNIRVTGGTISGVSTAGITTVYVTSANDGPLSGARNRIINGDCRIDQRQAGTASTISNGYPVDRWRIEYNGNGVVTGIQTSDVPTGQGFTNSIKLTSTARSTLGSNDFYQIAHYVEGFNVSDLDFGSSSAKTVTLSFWVKGSRTGTYNVQLANSDGSRTYTKQYTISSADTWQKVVLTYPGCPNGTWNTTNSVGFGFRFGFEYGSNFTTSASADAWLSVSTFANSFPSTTNAFMTNSNSTWFITGVQLERGTVASEFERRSYGQELALCQRYFETTFNRANSGSPGPSLPSNDSNIGVIIFGGTATGTTSSFIGQACVQFKVTKRSQPSIATYDLASPRNINKCHRYTLGSAGTNNENIVVGDISISGFNAYSSGTSTNSGIAFHYTADNEL